MDKTGSTKRFISSENQERIGLHYLGISTILAWYYCLWFTPNIFVSTPITDESVTYSWLSTLALTGIALLIAPFVLKKAHLFEHQKAIPVVAGILCIATLLFGLTESTFASPLLSCLVFPAVYGICNAVLWVAWGEFHARRKSNFSFNKFAFNFGVVMFITACVSSVLPHYAADAFVAMLPLVSAIAYTKENREIEGSSLPTLLPKATRNKASKATAVISIAIFITCAGCYFNIAIIPIDALFDNGMSYVVGIIGAGSVCLLIAIVQKLMSKNTASYRILPWLLVACIVSLALFANGDAAFYNLSFIITVTLAGVFEVFFIAYFGTLSAKGHLPPIFAFAVSSAVVRLGFFAGDTWAVVYEHNPFLAENFTRETSLFFLCLLAAMLVLLMRKESDIVQITQTPAGPSEIEEICDAAIEEFSLSKREGEILRYIARGYTVDNISKKLVISPYTTQTHVRHIYSKMHVHKRSELLDYINMHRGEND